MGKSWGIFAAALAIACVVSARAAAQTFAPLDPLASAGHFELGLHARSMKASARAEQAAWLTLTVPFDRLAAPRVVTVALPSSASAPAVAALAPSPTPPAAPEPTPTPLGFEQLRAFADFTRRTVSVGLAVAGAGTERARLDSLSSRARASALLPELRLRAVRNTDQALRWVPTTDDPYRVTQADGAGLILEASATFRFDRLVFAREELSVERLRQRGADERLKLEARIEQSLLDLLRARQLACSLDPNDPARTAHVVELWELFTLLDSLTAGWFAREAPGLARAVWGFPEAILGECQPPEPAAPATSAPQPVPTNPVASLDDSE